MSSCGIYFFRRPEVVETHIVLSRPIAKEVTVPGRESSVYDFIFPVC